VQRVSIVSSTETWTIDFGMAWERTESASAVLCPLPITKYDETYAAARTSGYGFTLSGVVVDEAEAVLRSQLREPLETATSARHLTRRSVARDGMHMQYPAFLDFPDASQQRD
jgi:hypothetical protein